MNNTKKIYTVSELNADIKLILEANFPLIWISGEISNLKIPYSKHYYFTLKDEKSQASCVMFSGQTAKLKFSLEDGMEIRGIGRITLYEPKGAYQIIFEHIEPEGAGALQKAFEQLKEKLFNEGLFDERFKKKIPFLPKKISIICSPTGAVIHDIINIITRRFPNVHLEAIPVRVQGKGAEAEISEAIYFANKMKTSDSIILARGGGSLEDLFAFNTEIVARAIFASEIPIISAIGHETDYTISDFTADLRAPTPSAAAELSVPVKKELEEKITSIASTLYSSMIRQIEDKKEKRNDLTKRLLTPKKYIDDLRLKTDDYTFRIFRIIKELLKRYKERLEWRIKSLNARNPLSLLQSGYGVIRLETDKKIIKSVKQVKINDEIDITLSDGAIKTVCRDIIKKE